jgi:hypothetical protein
MTSASGLFADRYRLLGRLGHGGMSDVYEAVDEQTGQRVALKVVRSEDPGLAGRMTREAGALKRVEHPGLVRMLDAGAAGGQAYLVMELVIGPTLAEILRQGPLDADRTAELGARIASALACVHAEGIVHRDVKPSNILIGPDGQARLADFGIARMVDTSTLTVTGTTLGTVAYMAPEQLEDNQVGPPADIWALGMVLLECLTGERVYHGPAAEVVARRLAGPVPVPDSLPARWRTLLARLLDPQPGLRPDGNEVAATLAGFALRGGWDDVTRPIATAALDDTMVEPVRPALAADPAQGNRSLPATAWLAVAAAAVVIVLVIALVAGSGKKHTASTTPDTTPAPATTAGKAPATTASTSPPTTAAQAPSPATTLGALVAALTTAVADGQMQAGVAQSISNPAQQAVTDAAAGHSTQAASDLQNAAQSLAQAEQHGQIAATAAGTVQSDLTRLASTLGLGAAASAPTTVPTTVPAAAPAPAPAPAPGPGPGGHGGKGKA